MIDSTTLLKRSIDVILANQDASGAYLASPNFGVYRYSWFRDGAFIAEAMRGQGHEDSAHRFHAWAARVVLAREAQVSDLLLRAVRGEDIEPDAHLHCRYTVDGETATEAWTNFQLDGFGTWMWSLAATYPSAAPQAVVSAVELLVPYLARFWSSPSYDWWEESMGHVHVSSIGCIAVGLEAVATVPWLSDAARREAADTARTIRRAIAEFGIVDGRLRKWLGGAGIDASCLALVAPLALLEPASEVAMETVAVIRRELADPGVHRHRDDTYFGGGQWLLLTAMLGLCEFAQADRDSARERLHWIEAQTAANGDMPEQVASRLLHPTHEAQWIERWGVSASPLLWSHAMYLMLHRALEATA